jgi:hypothetical protein
MKKIIVSLFLIFNVIFLFSQERRVITTAVPFLMISADARDCGLGEQGVATSPDAFSQHWNPAKYVFLDNASGVGVSYTPYLSKLVSDVFLANINYYNIIMKEVRGQLVLNILVLEILIFFKTLRIFHT